MLLMNQIEQLKRELEDERAARHENRRQASKQLEKLRQELEQEKMMIPMYKNSIKELIGCWLDLVLNLHEREEVAEQMMTDLEKTLDEKRPVQEGADTSVQTLLAKQKSVITELRHQAADSEERRLDSEMAMTELHHNYEKLQNKMYHLKESCQKQNKKIFMEKACQTPGSQSVKNVAKLYETPTCSLKFDLQWWL